MVIDILFMILMAVAVYKGYSKGFVVAVFSFLAVIIGIAAAMKLAVVVAGWLRNSTNITAAWLPFISFVAVMMAVILLVRLGAKLIESGMRMVLLGWANKLAGIILFAALYITVFSVLLFYAEKMQLIKPGVFETSRIYPFVQPWGPKAIGVFGEVIPWFRGMFDELSHFFETIHARIK